MKVLLDVDRTIIAPGNTVNVSLLRVLQQWGCDEVDLVTSYSLRGNAVDNAGKNALRIDAIRRLQRYGIQVRQVYISASPYYENETLDGKYEVGDYYKTAIHPIEKSISHSDRKRDTVTAILKTHEATVEAEWALIHKHIGEEQSETDTGQSTRGGKEHLLTHVLHQLPEKENVIFFDDKPEVVYRAKAIAQEAWLSERGITLKVHRIDWHLGDDRIFPYEESLCELTKATNGVMDKYLRAPIQPIMVISSANLLTLCASEFAQSLFLEQAKGYEVVLLGQALEDFPSLGARIEKEGMGYWLVKGSRLHSVISVLRKEKAQVKEVNALSDLTDVQRAVLMGDIEKHYGHGKPLHIVLFEDADMGLSQAIAQDFSNDPSIMVVPFKHRDHLLPIFLQIQHHHYEYTIALARQCYHQAFYEEDKSDEQRQAEYWLNLLEEGGKLCLSLKRLGEDNDMKNVGLVEEGSELVSTVSALVEEIRCMEKKNPFSFVSIQQKLATVARAVFVKSSHLASSVSVKESLSQEKQSARLFNQVINRSVYENIHTNIVESLLSYNDLSEGAAAQIKERALIRATIEGIMSAFIEEIGDNALGEEGSTAACKTTSQLLEKAANGMSQKKDPLKKHLRGLAGIALSLPTLGLAFRNEGYRDFFWHGRSKLEHTFAQKCRLMNKP